MNGKLNEYINNLLRLSQLTRDPKNRGKPSEKIQKLCAMVVEINDYTGNVLKFLGLNHTNCKLCVNLTGEINGDDEKCILSITGDGDEILPILIVKCIDYNQNGVKTELDKKIEQMLKDTGIRLNPNFINTLVAVEMVKNEQKKILNIIDKQWHGAMPVKPLVIGLVYDPNYNEIFVAGDSIETLNPVNRVMLPDFLYSIATA